MFSPLVSAATEALFELEPQYVTADGLPNPDWLGKLAPTRDAAEVKSLVQPLRLPVSARKHPVLNRIFRVRGLDEDEAQLWLRRIHAQPGVVWSEIPAPRRTCIVETKAGPHRDSPPGDPYFPLQWHLPKIQAPAAWDLCRGDTSVVIAVVDVGVAIDHGDLLVQRWINRVEASGQSGVDDDGNGFIDDLNGWDFYDNDADPRPEGRDAHGTHVAGIALAAADNGYGVAGVAGGCRLMAVRVGFGTSIIYGFEGVIYAAAAGADIINLSWGSDSPSNIERITIDYALEQGALIVAAAGNRTGGGDRFDHYPAEYKGVLAVAAVDSGDVVAGFSNYGEWVDLCAPGARILSTIPGGFGIMTGTSMATPMIAGAAALLKAYHPDWNSLQLCVQVIKSCDPIDRQNSGIEGLFGRGRLNLYRSLTDVGPGFDLNEVFFSDSLNGNNNGVIEPGERIEIYLEVVNRGTEGAELTVNIDSADAYISFTIGHINFGYIAPGASAVNTYNPFQARISANVPSGREMVCQAAFLTPDEIPQKFPFTLIVRPPYATHRNGQISLTVTNFGALGYFNYVRNETEGEGLRFPRSGIGALYHGSLIVAADTHQVSDNAYGDSTWSRFDFNSTSPGMPIREDEEGIQTSRATFSDRFAVNPMDIEVVQTAVSRSAAPDDDYIIMQYAIRNRGGNNYERVYAALFMDWDIVQAERNTAYWNTELEAGWMERCGGGFPVFGVALLNQPAGSCASILRSQYPGHLWTDEVKYQALTSGFDRAIGMQPGDYWQIVGTQSLFLPSLETINANFIIAAGEDRDDFFANISTARERWSWGPRPPQTGTPVASPLFINSVYPNPFNNSALLFFSINHSGWLRWRLVDAVGRQATSERTLWAMEGRNSLVLPGQELPTGVYFLELKSFESTSAIPVRIVR